MKLSKFNTIVFHEGLFLYHNSYTERFLLLESMLLELILAAQNEDNVAGLQEIHPDLYDALLTKGFVIPKEVDEIEKVKELIESIDHREDKYQLMILPTMNCNFKCWYCYETHIKGSKTSVSELKKIELLIDNTFNKMENLKVFDLSFFGGEPLLYYRDVIHPILKHTHQRAKEYDVYLHVHFTSNGFLINDEMVKDLVKYNVHSFQITFDGHGKDHDQVRYVSKSRGSYYVIAENIKKLVRNGISVSMRINYTQKSIDGLPNIFEDFKDLNSEERMLITLDMQKVWQEKDVSRGLYDKVEALKLEAREFGFNHRLANTSNTVRNSCYADKKNQAAINYNGDVYKCNARDFTEANREGVLNDKGEIVWNSRYQERLTVKLKNQPCRECSIMPICGGGCTQYALERLGTDFCIYDHDEERKKKNVLTRFLNSELIDAPTQESIAGE